MSIRRYSDSEIENLWDRGNDAGDGYAVGGEKMTPWEAAESEGMKEIRTFDTRGDTGTSVIALDGEDWVAICDVHGPWAVNISAMIEADEAVANA